MFCRYFLYKHYVTCWKWLLKMFPYYVFKKNVIQLALCFSQKSFCYCKLVVYTHNLYETDLILVWD